MRLDTWLVEVGHFASEREARGHIMAGDILVGGAVCTKPGRQVKPNANVILRNQPAKYASRGGLKLEHALGAFSVDVNGQSVLDAGASTGGFTDCLLQHGAARVYAVDAGFGQLRGRLARDDRVVVMEKTNISDLGQLPVDLIVADLSYLSLRRALPVLVAVAPVPVVALIKPLYEGLGDGNASDLSLVVDTVETLLQDLRDLGFWCRGVTPSPISGGQGAVELLGSFTSASGGGTPPHADAGLLDELRAGWGINALATDRCS